MANAELAGLDAAFIAALKSAGGLGNIKGNTLSMPKNEKEANQLGVNLTGPQVQQLEELVKANKKSTTALQKHNDALSASETFLDSMKTETEELTELQGQLNIAYDAGAMSFEKYTEAQNLIKTQMMQLKPEFQRLEKAANQAADGISDALADAFVNGKFSMESLGDVFKQVIKQMIADAIKAQIIKFLMSAVTGFFAGGGSVAPTNMGNTTLSHAGGGSISRYGRAGGGMAMPTLVGERGPELFVPHTAGVVRNNHDTKNMMGGGSPVVVNQNINIDAGVSQTVRAEVMSMMPRIKSETIQAMIDGKRRGNSISKAFA